MCRYLICFKSAKEMSFLLRLSCYFYPLFSLNSALLEPAEGELVGHMPREPLPWRFPEDELAMIATTPLISLSIRFKLITTQPCTPCPHDTQFNCLALLLTLPKGKIDKIARLLISLSFLRKEINLKVSLSS